MLNGDALCQLCLFYELIDDLYIRFIEIRIVTIGCAIVLYHQWKKTIGDGEMHLMIGACLFCHEAHKLRSSLSTPTVRSDMFDNSNIY